MSDRGMKKWAPYKTLDGQWDKLEQLHQSEDKIEKPRISNEMAEEINDILVNYHGQELEFFYYKNGRILKEKSTIKKIDAYSKKLILDNTSIIYLKDLIGIK